MGWIGWRVCVCGVCVCVCVSSVSGVKGHRGPSLSRSAPWSVPGYVLLGRKRTTLQWPSQGHVCRPQGTAVWSAPTVGVMLHSEGEMDIPSLEETINRWTFTVENITNIISPESCWKWFNSWGLSYDIWPFHFPIFDSSLATNKETNWP